jgi:hypothetical protein
MICTREGLYTQRRLVLNRVTRLGEFSPNRRFVSLDRLFQNYTISPNVLATIYHGKIFVINFNKKWVGLHLGRFFHKLIWSPWPQATVAQSVFRYTSAWAILSQLQTGWPDKFVKKIAQNVAQPKFRQNTSILPLKSSPIFSYLRNFI